MRTLDPQSLTQHVDRLYGGVPYRLLSENGTAVVTWQRDGHLYVGTSTTMRKECA
jgi:hypothetical protein